MEKSEKLHLQSVWCIKAALTGKRVALITGKKKEQAKMLKRVIKDLSITNIKIKSIKSGFIITKLAT